MESSQEVLVENFAVVSSGPSTSRLRMGYCTAAEGPVHVEL